MKRVILFGATGSVGQQAVDLISKFRDRFVLLGVSAKSNLVNLSEIVEAHRPPYVSVPDEGSAKALADRITYKPHFFIGDTGLAELARVPDADISVIAISGITGLIPAYHSLSSGKRLAIANKEAIIGGGHLLTKALNAQVSEIIPVDSEHSALFQLLLNEKKEALRKIYLTASGGPFLHFKSDELEKVTPELALKHPTWQMGAKITIDSATLMNKGFEVIEAAILFDLPAEKIEVLIHPQSIIHALVEFVDGTFFSHLSQPDMRLPLAYALFYPERPELNLVKLDLSSGLNLQLLPPDFSKYPCLSLAYEALKLGHPYPLILVASDEVAVGSFLARKIKFTTIPQALEKTINEFTIKFVPSSLEEILSFHEEVKSFTEEMIKKL